MWKRPSSNAESGLTLLELLVALAMAALVGVAVYSMQNAVMGAYDQVRDSRRADFGLRILSEVMNDDLRSIYTLRNGNDSLVFVGSPADSPDDPFMAFPTTAGLDLLDNPASTEVRLVRYLLQRSMTSDSYELVREERSYAAVEGSFEWRPAVVADSIVSLEVQYFDAYTDSYAQQFKSNPALANRPMAPRAVRLDMVMRTLTGEKAEQLLFTLPPATYHLVKP